MMYLNVYHAFFEFHIEIFLLNCPTDHKNYHLFEIQFQVTFQRNEVKESILKQTKKKLNQEERNLREIISASGSLCSSGFLFLINEKVSKTCLKPSSGAESGLGKSLEMA